MHIAVDLDDKRDHRGARNPNWKGGVYTNRRLYNQQWVAKRRASVRRFLASVALTVGCVDCGYNENALALEFDHTTLPGPVRVVSNAQTLGSAVEELDRCEVRCANCHSIRHRSQSCT